MKISHSEEEEKVFDDRSLNVHEYHQLQSETSERLAAAAAVSAANGRRGCSKLQCCATQKEAWLLGDFGLAC